MGALTTTPTQATDWRYVVRCRVLIGAAVIALWTAGIEARLIYLQIIKYNELLALAENQQLRTVLAPAKRGEILDRGGRVLAYSVDAESIYAVPSEINNPDETAETLCAELDVCGDQDLKVFVDRLRQPRAFVWIRRKVSPDEGRRIGALNLEGIGFLSEERRFYPGKELAAHLLGYVGIDNQGLGGVESTYDREIRGRPGKVLIQTDARGRAFSRVERSPTAGATLELTVDKYLQHIVERELRMGVEEHRADGGSIVVLDPNTGEVMALANEPTFNPNVFARSPESNRRNRAIQDIYEPGSAFKIVTASAALEEQVVRANDLVDVRAGVIKFGSREIKDVYTYDTLSFTDVIVKSSNVGIIMVGLKLGPERLGEYVKRFGFGQALSRDFQGESRGIVWDPSSLDDAAVASVSMGYQVGVTPLQMAAAVSAIANGGELLEPRLVRAVISERVRVERPRRVIRRVLLPQTTIELTKMMEGVVERGTAKRAQVTHHNVAGKTGTSAKIVQGKYSTTDYQASFVGFFPSHKPVLTILVVIDTPRVKGYYGGSVAAPIFRRVAEASLRHLGIPRTRNQVPSVVVAGAITEPDVLPRNRMQVLEKQSTTAGEATDQRRVPDVRGLSAREALRVLSRFGLTVQLTGDGVVVDQNPPAGSLINRGMRSALQLERWPLVETNSQQSP